MADEVVEPGTGTTQAPEAGTTVLTETVPEGEVKVEGTTEETKETAKADPKTEVPEAYELKAPEGVDLDVDALAAYTPTFKELGLTNEAAQKLMDAHLVAQKQALVTQHSAWVETVRKDPEIGGKAFDTSVKNAQSALARFGSPEIKSLLEATGLGSHPEFVRIFAKVGAAMAEPKIVSGVASTLAPSAAQVLYSNSNMK